MTFVEIPGFTGRLYVPDKKETFKKHKCKDCYSCGFCSDKRCELCCRELSCPVDKEDEINNNK